MKEIKDICIVVSARLNSHRIRQKMVAPFSGTTLLDISLNKLATSKVIPKNNIILATHEEELKKVARKHDIDIFHRSYESSYSEGHDLKVLYEWHDKINFKYVILINPCAPFLSTATIDNFFLAYSRSHHNGLFGVIPKKNYFWNKDGDMITKWPDGFEVMNTKYVDVTYEAAHCLYASRLSSIADGNWMGPAPYTKDNPALFELPEEECFDIDYPWQFKMAEALYGSKNEF